MTLSKAEYGRLLEWYHSHKRNQFTDIYEDMLLADKLVKARSNATQ